MSNLLVEVEQGKLKGKLSKSVNDIDYYTFKGIPYAKPPIGELRFCVPQPPEPWEGVRDSTLPSKFCAQFDKVTKLVVGDEDCLYLNVYTPKLPASDSCLLPVMVFFHGGGFVFGSGTEDSEHGPDYLIEKNVVIVSLNYRLGVLGFLSLDCKEATGNMGLKDQVQALKWVQKNISNFSGDPNNVTIFGISAGGASVEYLLLSPMAKGLFHKAIAQSGSSLLHWAQNANVKNLAFKIHALNGVHMTDEGKLLEYLKALPTADLLAGSMAVLAAEEFRGGINFGFVPTIEKSGDWETFLDKPSYELLSRGEFTKVPFMGGFCTREGLLMVSHGASILDKMINGKRFQDYFPFKIDDNESTAIENRLKDIYSEKNSNTNEPNAFAIDFFTDVDFLGGIYVATTLIAKNNSLVYFYEFTYDGNLNYLKKAYNIDRKGACHGDDGGYLIKSDKLKDEITESDKLVRNVMVEMWTNFAKYGNPTPQTNELITTKWEAMPKTGVACLLIDKQLSMKYDIYPQRMKLYQDFYQKSNNIKK